MSGIYRTIQGQMTAYGVQAQYNPNDPDLQEYLTIADAVGNPYPDAWPTGTPPAGDPSTNDAFKNYAIACMMTRTFLFQKHSPGDCGAPVTSADSGVQIASDLSTGIKLGAATAGTAAALISGTLATTSLTGVAIGASLGLAATGIGLLALPAMIFAGIEEHIAQERANDEAVLCGLYAAINGYWQQLDVAVQAGTISQSDANTGLTNALQQARTLITENNVRTDNGDVAYEACNAVTQYRQFSYARTYAAVAAEETAALSSSTSAGSTASSSSFGELAILGTVGEGAHLLGAF